MSKFANLPARIGAALVGAAILLFCIWAGPWTYAAIFMFVLLMSIREYIRLVGIRRKIYKTGLYITAFLFYAIAYLIQAEWSERFLHLIVPVISVGIILHLYRMDDDPYKAIGLYILGIIYIILPFALLNPLVYASGEYQFELLVGLLFSVWCSDTGAYFAGSAFGKHRLFERHSPKKSWEGAIGGVLFALFAGWVLSLYFPVMNTWQWIGFSGVVAVSGIYGDLVESMMKRSSAMKDSGTSIPGHGGFLDRFDSLIFSIPFALLFLKLFVFG
jgi:phosphatidate cytidylyltransferase